MILPRALPFALAASLVACGDRPAVYAPTVPAPSAAVSPAQPSTDAFVRWRLFPVATTAEGRTARRIDLEIDAGGVHHVVPIMARDVMMFVIDMQVACTAPAVRDDAVADLYLNGGGNLRYVVKREAPSRVALYEEASSDGLCTDPADKPIPCEVARARLTTIAIPESTARFVQSYIDMVPVDVDAGSEAAAPLEAHRLACSNRE